MVKPMMTLIFAFTLLTLPLAVIAQRDKAERKIPDYSLLKRAQVPAEFTWKIEDIYPNLEAWKADKDAVEQRIAGIDEKARGWTETAQSMLALLRWLEEINLKGARLFAYAGHQYDVDMGDSLFSVHARRVADDFRAIERASGFFQRRRARPGSGKVYRLSEKRTGADSVSFSD